MKAETVLGELRKAASEKRIVQLHHRGRGDITPFMPTGAPSLRPDGLIELVLGNGDSGLILDPADIDVIGWGTEEAFERFLHEDEDDKERESKPSPGS
jgi:hypothetical protein